MNISSSQDWTTLKRKTLRSIKRILFADLDQDLLNFDEKVEEIVKKLLQGGLSALKSERVYFPNFDATFSRISNDEFFQEFQNSDLDFQSEEFLHINNVLLAEVFQKLKSQTRKYDENFTLVLDLDKCENLEKEKLKKEALMLPIIQKHKESDFETLFNAFRPLLFDLLKRREGFEDFTKSLRLFAKREEIVAQNIIKQLEVKDILLLLVESCSQASLPQLGLWFSYQFYPLPLISLLGQSEYHSNLECCLEYLFRVRKPLITSIGTKSALGVGKSSFLSYLFSFKDPEYFSTKDGFTHFGAVDLYVNLPCDQQNYIVADVQSFGEDQVFMNMLSEVLSASQIILVHITEKDISAEDGQINLGLKMNLNDKSKILYLWRDYDSDLHSDLMNKAEKRIKNSVNELAIIGIPKLSGKQSFDVQNNKSEAMHLIFQKIDSLNLQNCTPLVDLFLNLKRNEVLDLRMKKEFRKVDFENETKEVENLLNERIKQGSKKSFTESLLPCLFQDYKIIEERKKRKVWLKQHREGIKEEDVQKQEENYKKILKIIKACKAHKKQIQPSSLTRKVVNVISSNDLSHILLLSEIINNWKMPRLEDIRKKYIALSAQNDGANLSEKNDLANEMDDKDLSLSTFLDEVLSYFESHKNAKDASEYKGIKKYLLSSMLQGAPLNLVNGKTLKFGNRLFKEIFDKETDDMKNIFVISIIGAQSSAKSTLLNVLFGCGFSTSAGRCTKGIYISLLRHQSGFKIIVIDTEGLLSVVGRDYEFDNLIATMAFSCSHIVIINSKGEINTKLRDLLEICVYAMKHLKLNSIKPKIIFALRDMLDQSDEAQQAMLLAMKSSLEQAANKLSININHIIDFSQKDIFLLPSAFQLSSGQNKTNIQTNNDLFSLGVLKMRQSLFQYLASIQDNPIPNAKCFYDLTEQVWNTISELGSDIMRAKNLLEIELKDEALDQVNVIWKTYSEKLMKKGEEGMEFYKAQLRNNRLSFGSFETFSLVMDASFRDLKETAIKELNDKIFSDERYQILANNEKEFKQIVEYNLRWQKQRFESEWKVAVYYFETDQEIKKLKSDISKKVNEKIQSLSSDNLKEQIINYFNGLISKLQKEFDENLEQLQKNITNNLPMEILGQFESAQKIVNRDKAHRVMIPHIDDIFSRINGHTNYNYDTKLLFKAHFLTFLKTGEVDKNAIKNELWKFAKNLSLLIKDKPSEETALNVINDCLSRVQKMETDDDTCRRERANGSGFMRESLLEAMHYQYRKAFDAETKKTKEKQIGLQKVIKEEEKYVKDLLENSSNSFDQGKRCANHWFKCIRTNFCAEQEQVIQEAIMKEMRRKFPAPETANEKAYKESFVEENYKNCLKYILNINLFIHEIFEQEILTLTEKQILQEINVQVLKFIELMNHVRATVEEWSKAKEQSGNSIHLGTLLCYIEKNEDLKKYFPNLYDLSLKDVGAFTQGCANELAILIQKDNFEKELKAIITQNVEEYLKTQYEDITGCQARCPMCSTKCTLANSPHNDHHTNCHLLTAFSRSFDTFSHELILRSCFDPKNYDNRWLRGEKEFNSYDEMIDKEFPNWRQEFPTKHQRDKLEAHVPTKVKKCWIAIKDVLATYYGKKENTPQSWFDDAKDVIPLRSDFYLEDYMNKSYEVSDFCDSA